MKIKNAIWKSKNAYLFILPLFTGLLIFSYYPAFSSIYHSFFEWDILGNKQFVGFDNFKNLLKAVLKYISVWEFRIVSHLLIRLHLLLFE